jgi:hypothetical protein
MQGAHSGRGHPLQGLYAAGVISSAVGAGRWAKGGKKTGLRDKKEGGPVAAPSTTDY